MPDLPDGRLADLRAASQLLQSGAYEHAADMLQNAQSATEATGNTLDVVPIAAVREICLACLQCQAEVEWHRQAGQTAEQRQEQLKSYAQTLLDRIREQALADDSARATTTETYPAVTSEVAQPPRRSLDVRGLMHRARHLFVPERTTSAPQPQGSEGPLLPDGEPVETPGRHLREEDTEVEPTPWTGVAQPETPAAPAPPGEIAVLAPLGRGVEEEEPELALPPGIGESEALVISAPSGQLPEIPPAGAEEEEEEPQRALPAGIEAREASFVSAPALELPEIPLRAQAEKEKLAPALPADVGEPNAPSVSVLPTAVPRAPESFAMAIYCLGSFRVYQHDQAIEEWSSLRGQAVLKYLVAHRGTPTAKDVLMDVFWPEADPEAARRNLHQAIYSLRQTLRRRDPGIQHIQFENNQYSLNPALNVWIDVEEFQNHLRAAGRREAAGQLDSAMADYGAAEGLYQGDFLAEDLYDDWPRAQRERLRTIYLDIANGLSEYYREQGEYASAITVCQKILTLDNCVEEAHRRLMQCYLAQGRRHLAIRQYHTCVQALAKELDVPPSDDTQALYASISANL